MQDYILDSAASAERVYKLNYELIRYQWGLRLLHPAFAWDNLSQKSLGTIGVAIIDSGIDTSHENLRDSIESALDLCDSGSPNDSFGHGTMVAGIIAARSGTGKGMVGLAPGVRLHSLKIFDTPEEINSKPMLKALEWCIAHKVQIVNISMSKPVLNSPNADQIRSELHESRLIEELSKKGAVIVASVGNEPSVPMRFPATHPQVLPVSAARIRQNPWRIQRYPGCCIADNRTIFAPGEYIISSFPGNKYGYTSGASAATAFISASTAILCSLNKNACPEEIKRCIHAGSRVLQDEQGTWRFLNLSAAAMDLMNRPDKAYE